MDFTLWRVLSIATSRRRRAVPEHRARGVASDARSSAEQPSYLFVCVQRKASVRVAHQSGSDLGCRLECFDVRCWASSYSARFGLFLRRRWAST